jgi:hypothetical protein
MSLTTLQRASGFKRSKWKSLDDENNNVCNIFMPEDKALTRESEVVRN